MVQHPVETPKILNLGYDSLGLILPLISLYTKTCGISVPVQYVPVEIRSEEGEVRIW